MQSFEEAPAIPLASMRDRTWSASEAAMLRVTAVDTTLAGCSRGADLRLPVALQTHLGVCVSAELGRTEHMQTDVLDAVQQAITQRQTFTVTLRHHEPQ